MDEIVIPEDPGQMKEWQSKYATTSQELIQNFFTMMFKSGIAELPGGIAKALQKLNVGTETTLSKMGDGISEYVLKHIVDYGIIDKKTAENILKLKGLPFPVNILFNVIAVFAVLGNYVGQVGSILGTPAQRNLMTLASPNLPREEFLIKAGFVAPELITEVRGELRKSGFSERSIDLMFLSSYTVYDVETVRNLYLRKAIDIDTMFMRIKD
ncbi:unnamed protein product [marine sediment metagenome]|uniref:Uncharacterized protein n=1 Tax=marine sediment metagenome TaxID=412755 RepID=X1GKH6_9ZZZZ